MNFNEYQKKSRLTAIYPSKGLDLFYPVLGLVGEAGEVAEKIKKVFRDKNGVVDEARRMELIKELGDVLWYLANLSTDLGLSLGEIAQKNLEKLFSRKARGTIHGEGDDR